MQAVDPAAADVADAAVAAVDSGADNTVEEERDVQSAEVVARSYQHRFADRRCSWSFTIQLSNSIQDNSTNIKLKSLLYLHSKTKSNLTYKVQNVFLYLLCTMTITSTMCLFR